MNDAEIQIQFPKPGAWGEFILTTIYQDVDGYTRTDRYTQDDIPADQAPPLAAVVAALVGMSEPWQAAQVWARLDWYYPETAGEDDPVVRVEAVYLDVEARSDAGGRRIFTVSDYPAFILIDPAAVAFFKYFTTTNQ